MNKLLYVNIGSLVFQIDETAYQKLDHYLNGIRKKYSSTQDGDEIIHDIELRIAELFTEKVGEKGAITMMHVDEIISIMGSPEIFESHDSNQNQESTFYEEKQKSSGTRFYRDKENNIVGGVCSGFAAKFDVDVLWIRLAFLLTIFFVGAGFLLYIILWIIMPEAKTTSEKLEMRGEKINIDNIEKTVKDGTQNFKKKASEFGEEVKQTFSKENMDKSSKNIGDFVESAVLTIKPIGKAIMQILAAIIGVICIIILVVLGIELISDSRETNATIQFLGNHVIGNGRMSWILIVCALSLIVIPIAGILFSISKYLLGIKKKFKGVSITLGILWTIAFSAAIFVAIKIGLNFKEEATITNRIEMQQPSSDIAYLQLNTLQEENILWKRDYREDWDGIVMHDDSAIFKKITVTIEPAVDTNYSIIISKYARGNSFDEAKTRASEFDFAITQNDSLFQIPGSVILKDYELWRDQEVNVTVQVPQNKMILIDSKLDRYMQKNIDERRLTESEFYGHRLIMTADGLKSL